MTSVTEAPLERRMAQDSAARRRRAVAARIRDARHKLTERTGLRPDFDRELTLMYARTRLRAAPIVPLLAVLTGGAALLWSAGAKVLWWFGLMMAAHGLLVLFARRFEAAAGEAGLRVAPWRSRFVAAEFLHGICWASLWMLLSDSPAPETRVFLLAAMLVVVAVNTMLASNLPAAVSAATLPVTGSLVLAFGLSDGLLDWIMAALAAGAQAYFLVLARRLHGTTLAMLEYRAEKDALIAELDQARINADESRRRAEAANVAKSRFLATMSHELRTPLNAILGFSEVMKAELFGPHSSPIYREYADDIHASGQHLLNLINEILDLSRIEAGRYELNEDAVSLVHAVEECARLMQIRARRKGIDIVEKFEPDLPKLWADERALRQICLNLLSNAVKFTPPGGTVTLKVGWTVGGGQYLTVADTGPGIPEDEIPIVLSSFGQGSLAHKTAEQGAGLGLPIVKGLVDLHGGGLDLRSKPRVGTQVTVTFPPERVMRALAPLAETPRLRKAG